MTESPDQAAAPTPVAPITEARRLAWAILARAALTASAAVDELLAAADGDPERVAARLTIAPAAVGVPADLAGLAVRDLERAAAVGARLLTREDPQWPTARFARLDAPQVCGHAPLALWLRGPRRLDPFAEDTVAVVGARAATDYGSRVAYEMAATFAERGWTVISGGAFGIDTAAHRGALGHPASTIAVTATGIDRYYPIGNQRLLEQISTEALMVSEYPPQTGPARDQFLQRNRITVALARAVVIVEGGRVRGGSANTARWARELARPVFAVPGPITSAASGGPHALIRDGHARLITDATQVIDDLRATPGI
ncbi:DNA-processing protein DprA [Nocardia sp. NPDC050793]|uniref:DNA-processing protein DprA n=1 Tax=Nocardia sp. NPDC050793 TaxID=3155159 RepID=UPI0033D1FA7E